MFLIVGLGNPGKEYENTRHNIGFEAIKEISLRNNIKLTAKTRHLSIEGEGSIEREKVVLAMPQTFMNRSGEAVLRIKKARGIEISHVIIIHDDLDLEPGDIRIKKGGGTAGHNGLESIVSCLGSGDFIRVRIGVGKSAAMLSKKISGADYVLSKIAKSQAALYRDAAEEAAQAAEEIICRGLHSAMNIFNRKK